VPTPKRPSKPLGKNALYRVLTNPYYAGVIRYKDALHPGAHEPIVEPALFDQVQSLLKARNAHATRHVQHAHHLKGLLHCGTCGSRMLLDFATNPRGTTYAYFVCSGRAAKRTACTRRAVPVQVAERLVEDSYASITISEDDYRHLAAEVDAAFDKRSEGRDQEFADLTANRARLESESDKVLAAHFADAIDLPTLKRHQDRIRAGLADIERRLREHDERHTGGGRSSTTACGSSPTRTTPTLTPTTGAGGWRTKRSTRAWRSPRTSSYAHASQSHSQRSSARRPEARKPNGNTPHLPMSRVPVRHIGWS
jgi:site-specific DNA recombinase